MKLQQIACIVLLGLSLSILATSCIETSKADPALNAHLDQLTWHDASSIEATFNAEGKSYMLVDIYTDWCKWCKVMDEKTFSDGKVKQKLNADFSLVKFNAESVDPIQFKGRDYTFLKQGRRGFHSLAQALVSGRLSYPSFVILDDGMNTVEVIRGFKNPDEFLEILDKYN